MPSYWLTFRDHQAGCVEADTETEARRIALEKTGCEPVACAILPYPAEPRINTVEHTHNGRTYVIPSFCFTPHQCSGRTSCPRRRACDD